MVEEVVKETKKSDDSVWEQVQVTVQTAPALQNKKTGEILQGEEILKRILEDLTFIKKVVG